MNINVDLLQKLILKEIKECNQMHATAAKFVIGDIGNARISICIDFDEDEKEDLYFNDENICIGNYRGVAE